MKPTLITLIQFARLNNLMSLSFDNVYDYYVSTVKHGAEGCGCILPAKVSYDIAMNVPNELPF